MPSPAENLALDEALLDAAEAGELADDVLRLWEPTEPFVVVGRSSRQEEEVNVAACQAAGIPVLRRASGGAAIVTGPGCLMYAVVLSYTRQAHLRLIDEAHRHVLGIVRSAVSPLIPGVEHAGTSDLAIAGRKFSGNSLRCKRDHFLYHGTLLYHFDLSLIERLLRTPPRQPAYRAGKPHGDFVRNLQVDALTLRQSIALAFGATVAATNWPQERTAKLKRKRYLLPSWNQER